MKNNNLAIAENMRLAGLLGWSNVVEVGGALAGTPPVGAPECRGQALVPDWAGDWSAIGPMSAEHGIEMLHDCTRVYGASGTGHFVGVQVGAGPGERSAAACLALTRAVADKLEASK